jgi:hypothetical protein
VNVGSERCPYVKAHHFNDIIIGDTIVNHSMAQDDKEYFRTRAMQELERAQAADHPAAILSHSTLAGFYLSRASDQGSLLK